MKLNVFLTNLSKAHDVLVRIVGVMALLAMAFGVAVAYWALIGYGDISVANCLLAPLVSLVSAGILYKIMEPTKKAESND